MSADMGKIAVQVTEAILNLSEALNQPIIEATQGYRRQMESAGFSPSAAEIMAATYHDEVLKMLFKQVANAQAGKK